jgi:trypsin
LQGAGGPPPPPLLQLAVLPSSALSNDTAPEDDEAAGTVELKIINGEQAPVEQFGFMVALLQQGRFFCGGTLLDALTVLTAAHCVVDTDLVDDPSQLTVWRVDGSQYPVAQILAHPGYSASTIPTDNKDLTFSGDLHDLAALRLGQPVPEPVTVSLPDASLVVPSGAGLQVAGWGVTENGQPSSILK